MTNNLDFPWYKLFQAKGFGPKSIHIIHKTIYKDGFSLKEVFNMNKHDFEHTFPQLGRGRFKKANFDVFQRQNEERVYEEYQRLKDKGVEVIPLDHEVYPKNVLKLMEDGAPPLLFCEGQLSLLQSEGIAIVGSRNASDEGVKIARQFAAELAIQGENVISGYAKGIDTNAHLGALEENGTTTIVLSFGILEFSKKKIFSDLKWKGNTLIISQFHPVEKWSARNAMIRNKLVCALSKALIVIESGEERGKSGSMSGTFDTGKTALEMKIPLFVVSPGSFRNLPLGNKGLIKCGGIEIESRDSITTLLKCLETKNTKEAGPVVPERQMSFFK